MPCSHNMEKEKPIDFWLRKGKAVGETEPTETIVPVLKRVLVTECEAVGLIVHKWDAVGRSGTIKIPAIVSLHREMRVLAVASTLYVATLMPKAAQPQGIARSMLAPPLAMGDCSGASLGVRSVALLHPHNIFAL